MIHLRYDWRRPLLWACICLVFFLSSQGSGPAAKDQRTNAGSAGDNEEWAAGHAAWNDAVAFNNRVRK